MRTTLNIPDDLMSQVMRELGFTSKTDAVILALQELMRSRKMDDLRAMRGKVEIDVDLPKARRRLK